MANLHNKHVSTQWGIAILGFMLVAVALLIPYLGQVQDTRSRASGYDYSGTPCSAPGVGNGVCEYTDKGNACPTHNFVSNHCPGPADMKCCILQKSGGSSNGSAPTADSDSKYIGRSCSFTGGSGSCQYTDKCSTYSVSNHCPGSSHVKCCAKGIAVCQTPYGNGFCINKRNYVSSDGVKGTFYPGYCAGPSNIQCLVAK